MNKCKGESRKGRKPKGGKLVVGLCAYGKFGFRPVQ